jgi:hypothetical protein
MLEGRNGKAESALFGCKAFRVAVNDRMLEFQVFLRSLLFACFNRIWRDVVQATAFEVAAKAILLVCCVLWLTVTLYVPVVYVPSLALRWLYCSWT